MATLFEQTGNPAHRSLTTVKVKKSIRSKGRVFSIGEKYSMTNSTTVHVNQVISVDFSQTDFDNHFTIHNLN